MGRKRVAPQRVVLTQKPTKEEVRLAAVAWAEFLYDEYCIDKQKQLILNKKRTTMEKLTKS